MAGNRGQVAGIRPGSQRERGAEVGTARANLHWSYSLVSALAQSGVEHFVVSSGARSAPLVLAIAQLTSAQVWPCADERAAGFWALGIGKALRRPAALVCTSGTAAANYFPAIIEAHYSRTPLVVLTADRPPRLRGHGAPQTIDQIDLYSRYPRYFRDLPVPSESAGDPRVWIDEAVRSVAIAMGSPRGPVHLNVPFDEPLVPPPSHVPAIIAGSRESQAPIVRPPATASEDEIAPDSTWDGVARVLEKAARPLIVCGPQNDRDDLSESVSILAGRLGAPILADIASQVRFGDGMEAGVIAHYDLILRDSAAADSLVPDCILRLGGLSTSKTLNEWLALRDEQVYIAIEDGAQPADPYANVTHPLSCDLLIACLRLAARLPDRETPEGAYRESWSAMETAAASFLTQAMPDRNRECCFEGDVAATVFESAPEGTTIYLSNSLPIRMADMFASKQRTPLRVLVNRGANGIDGLISSAGGAAAALGRPTVLLIGDIAFLHDLNGLSGVARHRLPLKIILINNDGGGIFSFLPIAEHQSCFDELVAMPHGYDFAAAARFSGIPYEKTSTLTEFKDAYRVCLAREGPTIIELKTNREKTRMGMDAVIRNLAQNLKGHSA